MIAAFTSLVGDFPFDNSHRKCNRIYGLDKTQPVDVGSTSLKRPNTLK
jgi:hypothetical protein